MVRKNNGLLEPGQMVTTSPKTMIAIPMIASETQALVKRRFAGFLIVTNSFADRDCSTGYGTAQ